MSHRPAKSSILREYERSRKPSLLGRIFRERSFYVRGASGVRLVTIRPWMQASALGIASLLAFWTAYATVNTVFKNQMLVMKERKLQAVRMEAAAREARLRQQIDALGGKLMLDQKAWLAKVDELRRDYDKLVARQKVLSDFLSQTGLAKPRGKDAQPPAAPASRDGRGSLLPRGSLTSGALERPFQERFAAPFRSAQEAQEPLNILRRRLADMKKRQIALLDLAMARAARRLARVRKIYRKLGLDPVRAAASAKFAPKAIGGPFLPVLARDEGARPLVRRMTRISAILGEAQTLRHEMLARLPVALPMRNFRRISSRFGYRSDPFRHTLALHAGIDFKAAYGAPIHAPAPGVVTYAGWAGSYGRLVKIRHDNGLETRYAHMSAILVRKGQRVRRGTRIGRLGNTGRSTGAHLHYEIRLNGKPMNPERFWKARNDISKIKIEG